MSNGFEQLDLPGILDALESNRDAAPWVLRRGIAASLNEYLTQSSHREVAIRIAQILADDPKWEVRKETAAILPLIPDAEFAPLAAKLSQDSNSFVRKMAERAVEQRRKGFRDGSNRRRGIDQVVEQFDLLAATQGKAITERARNLATRLYEYSVSATVHDMRGVLTSTRAKLAKIQQATLEAPNDREAMQSGLSQIDERLVYLEKYVNAMSLYSQAIPQERVPVQLFKLVNEAREVASDAVASQFGNVANVEVIVSVAEPITVMVARHQMLAAITNVLKNAYEAIVLDENRSRPGRIDITSHLNGNDEVRTIILDNGMGLSSEDLLDLRAFAPGRTTKRGLGTGFGLPIAQRNIAAHGGSISVESTQNQGTTVTITLPLETRNEVEE
jgi:signal transduction histidine kinase